METPHDRNGCVAVITDHELTTQIVEPGINHLVDVVGTQPLRLDPHAELVIPNLLYPQLLGFFPSYSIVFGQEVLNLPMGCSVMHLAYSLFFDMIGHDMLGVEG